MRGLSGRIFVPVMFSAAVLLTEIGGCDISSLLPATATTATGTCNLTAGNGGAANATTGCVPSNGGGSSPGGSPPGGGVPAVAPSAIAPSCSNFTGVVAVQGGSSCASSAPAGNPPGAGASSPPAGNPPGTGASSPPAGNPPGTGASPPPAGNPPGAGAPSPSGAMNVSGIYVGPVQGSSGSYQTQITLIQQSGTTKLTGQWLSDSGGGIGSGTNLTYTGTVSGSNPPSITLSGTNSVGLCPPNGSQISATLSADGKTLTGTNVCGSTGSFTLTKQ
jgi:hypothetical protein